MNSVLYKTGQTPGSRPGLRAVPDDGGDMQRGSELEWV